MKKLILITVGIIALFGIVLWIGGFVTPGRIRPHKVDIEAVSVEMAEVVVAERTTIPVFDDAVGTIRPRTETNISAQITGRILSIDVKAGGRVRAGDVLVRLDDRELRSRADQARRQVEVAEAAVRGAEEGKIAASAGLAEAESSYKREQDLFQKESSTRAKLEAAESAYKQANANAQQAAQKVSGAQADLARAQEAVREAEVASGYSMIAAPEDGEVAKRLCEPGDLAWPGKALVVLQSEGALRLEASVREGLIGRVPLGAAVTVHVSSMNKDSLGTVDEIVPYADPVSRTFIVKVSIPSEPGMYPGMFGRLLIDMGTRQAVTVPKRVITRVGQLQTVWVDVDGEWTRRYVRTGREIHDTVEVLSGLSGGERLGVAADISKDSGREGEAS